jgi:peptidoglycan endopeptidase LytF
VVEPWYAHKGYDKGGYDGHDGHDGYGAGGHGDYGYNAYGQAGAGMCSYTVAAGDNLAWVAQSMGASTYDLISANGIMNPDLIYVGQVLSNPTCSAAAYAGAAYSAEAGYAAADYAATDYAAVDYSGADYAAGAYPAAEYAATDTAGSDFAGDPYAGAAQDYPMASAAPAGVPGYAATADAYLPADALPYAAAQGAPGYDVAVALPPASGSAGAAYAVQSGDTLSQIAAANGVSVRTLMDANGINNPNIIFVGQVLVLP